MGTPRKDKNSLNEREEQFCQEYIKFLNLRRAGEAAGYKSDERNLWKKVQLPKIQKRIKQLKEERNERVQISQDYVLRSLKDIVDRCLNEKKFQPKPANKSLELLGKHLGMFAEKFEYSGENGGAIKHNIKIEFINSDEHTE